MLIRVNSLVDMVFYVLEYTALEHFIDQGK